MLHHAHAQVRKLVDYLVESEINQPAMNFLADGSFGFSVRFLLEIIRKLGRHGRKPHIEFYLSNGPWQRDHEQNRPALGQGFGTDLTRQEFMTKIQTDLQYQAQFQGLAARLIPAINAVLNHHGGQVYIVPMLEDNIDLTTFNTMLQLASVALAGLSVRFGRNPATGDKTIPPGCFEEVHALDGDKPSDGIYTNDGPYSDFGTLVHFRNAARAHDSMFIAFSGKNQGDRYTPVAHRRFHLPSEGDRKQYLALLTG